MKNDAKLGMLAGVIGVIVAAVLLTNTQSPRVNAGTLPKEKPTPQAVPPPAATPASASQTNTAALPSTPVPRTRKDVDAQPASRQGGTEEEP